MGGTDGQAKVVGGGNGGHCDQFRAGSLGIGQMLLADFFSDGHNDALPTDHRSHTQRQGHSHLDPDGDKFGGLIDLALVIGEDRILFGGKGGVVILLHQADGFAGHIHVVAHVRLLVRGNRLEFLIECHFVIQVLNQLTEGQDRIRLQLFAGNVTGDFGAGVGANIPVLSTCLSRILPACSEAAIKA